MISSLFSKKLLWERLLCIPSKNSEKKHGLSEEISRRVVCHLIGLIEKEVKNDFALLISNFFERTQYKGREGIIWNPYRKL